ncbi:MFS transporter [Corynebacterium imitans]|uniref:MFS transporter n=1 Tax=Corynebacterium imitans TaxID=156978 RepID=UPI00254FAAB4|nr:MFS transporter [Corynebacterium imitans]MDK8307378.1 MFS transporter [Corynebacterium imitans]MDK8638506.1 MFS transporter [Corynebacterium imitans]MDK8773752.1 MFS transporter [Corynebacterium imitans]
MTSSTPEHPQQPTPSAIPETQSGWRALFSKPHLSAVIVMASGVGLYAMNLYFTAALMPTVVSEIGGEQYYAWASTGYLITAVIATMFVSRMLTTQGAARAYVTAYLLFAAGTLISAASPTMELFVTGRAVQGFGAGLLTGLGYAVIRSVLPQTLWTRGTGVVSAMFGIGTLVGPALGGVFAELDAWRPAFGVLAALAIALTFVTLRALPRHKPAKSPQARVPIPSIIALALTSATLSLSSTLSSNWVPVMIGAGLLLLIVFLAVDARDVNGVLPRLTDTRGNQLKWVYLTVAALCAGVMTENFIPLFGQQLANLSPLLAGLLGAVLSLGWVVAQLFSANATGNVARAFTRTGPVLLTFGLVAYGLLQVTDASALTVVLWVVVLLIAGVGIGLAFPHLSVAAMSSSDDEVEGAKAAAAVSTTQLIAFTLTSAIAGNLLVLGGASDLTAARWLILGIAVITLVGIFTAHSVTRKPRTAR